MTTHLIQFPSAEDYKRGISALLDVPQSRVGLPEYKMMVTKEHLAALNDQGIPYQDLTRDVTDNEQEAPVRS